MITLSWIKLKSAAVSLPFIGSVAVQAPVPVSYVTEEVLTVRPAMLTTGFPDRSLGLVKLTVTVSKAGEPDARAHPVFPVLVLAALEVRV